jgi:DNA gyrase/topoisomerase IV subunit B
MVKQKEYTASDIVTLSDREHVRLRTQVYLGNTHKIGYEIPLFINDTFNVEEIEFIPAVYKAVGEILDNCIDEFAQLSSRKDKVLKIEASPVMGWYSIADNGRGIPIDKHESGKYTPEVALGALRAGRNFGNEKDAGVIGQNGVGSACTNFCSTEFSVEIQRDKKRYLQRFTEGGLNISKPTVRKTTSPKTGTKISFTLDNEVFEDVALDERLMLNRAIEIAFTNPNITVEYNKKKFKFKKGLEDVIRKLTKQQGSYHKFSFTQDHLTMDFYVVFGLREDLDEKVFTWLNSSLLFDGGSCNTQFLNAFYDAVIKQLQPQAKKSKVELTKNDIRQNLLVFGDIKLSNPEYDAQSKTRMTGPSLRNQMIKMVENEWKSFARKNKPWLEDVLERAITRYHGKADKRAIKEHQKQMKKKVPGLVDATGRDRQKCQILITEGLSAASMITDVRDPTTTATFPLTGKINNVYGSTVAQVLKMGKVTNLLTAIGLTPGQKTHPADLRYGKIIIATDSDYDGDDIFTLLINLFYQFWPELFDKKRPVIHRLVAPNVCMVKGNQRRHFATRADYERAKGKYKGWEVNYYKGLGSQERQDWEMILNGDTDTLIPIYDDGLLPHTLKLLFSNDAEPRKEWLKNQGDINEIQA